MRTWAFVQQKGGSGKSTTCVNLAVLAEAEGESVLIVDLDPQSNLALWASVRGTNKPPVLESFPEKLPEIVKSAETLGVTLVMVDTPSKIDATALAAIRAADMVICPTMPDLFNVGSLKDTTDLLEATGKLAHTVGVVNNVEDDNTAEDKIAVAKGALEGLHMAVAEPAIRHRTQFAAAIEEGLGVTQMPRAKKANAEIRALWEWLDNHSKTLSKPTANGSMTEARH
jgi:chromosome partitioning protein